MFQDNFGKTLKTSFHIFILITEVQNSMYT